MSVATVEGLRKVNLGEFPEAERDLLTPRKYFWLPVMRLLGGSINGQQVDALAGKLYEEAQKGRIRPVSKVFGELGQPLDRVDWNNPILNRVALVYSLEEMEIDEATILAPIGLEDLEKINIKDGLRGTIFSSVAGAGPRRAVFEDLFRLVQTREVTSNYPGAEPGNLRFALSHIGDALVEAMQINFTLGSLTKKDLLLAAGKHTRELYSFI